MTRLAPALLLLTACSRPEPIESFRHAVSVVFFITADCPIANGFAPEIKRIVADYSPRRVYFGLVYTDLSKTIEDARRHAQEYGYDLPVSLDEGRVQSRRYGVTVTPEAVLLDAGGNRVYRGRIDDRYLAPGQYRLQPTTRELRDAIEAVLERRPVPVAETKAAGCPLTE